MIDNCNSLRRSIVAGKGSCTDCAGSQQASDAVPVWGPGMGNSHAGTADGGMKMLMGGGEGVHRSLSSCADASCCCRCRCCSWSCVSTMGSSMLASMQWMDGALVATLDFCLDHASSAAAAMKLTVRQSMG